MTEIEAVQRRLRERPHAWLVTGAAGFIGSHLVQALLELDQRVVGLDDFSLGKPENLEEVRAATNARRWRNFRFIEGDVRSRDTCARASRGVQFVLHHAALGSVPGSLADPIAAHEVNAGGTLNVLVAARDAGVARVVYASSSAVYGNYPAVPQVEAQTGAPLSPYAATKSINELYAGVFARCYGLQSIGLRYFNVFGPRQDPQGAYAAVIPAWIAAMVRGEPVWINGDGSTTRDFCYVKNVVEANLLAATALNPGLGEEVYNIGLDCATSLNELFEIIRSLLEPHYPRLRGLRPRYREFRDGDVRHSRADTRKARRLLGYDPWWGVGEGLAAAIDWYVASLAVRRPVRGEAIGAEAAAAG